MAEKSGKDRRNSAEFGTSDPDNASSARALFADDPPLWFTSYMENFKFNMEKLIITKLKEQDEKIEAIKFDVNYASEHIRKLEDLTKKMELKLDDLENRSRRNNLILFGVPEPAGMRNENCMEVVSGLLTDFVGVDPGTVKASLQRCHRTPTFKPVDSDGGLGSPKPRMIHMSFATFTAREEVRKQCIAKFKNEEFNGRKVFVAEDLSKKVQLKRKAKMDAFKKLQKEGKKPFFYLSRHHSVSYSNWCCHCRLNFCSYGHDRRICNLLLNFVFRTFTLHSCACRLIQ